MGVMTDWYEAYILRYKLRLVLGAIAVFFVSMIMSCQELRYMVSGKTVEVPLQLRDETTFEHGEKDHHLVAGYNYDDNGTPRGKYVKEPLDWAMRGKQQVKIQYIPGRDASRFFGDTNKGWVFMFFGSLAALGIGIFLMTRE